tara:strand:- start:4333 stop:4608 length:276 start_codon:yes stop_codon:yes gene_type:complete
MILTKSKLKQIIQEELEIDEVFGLGKKKEDPELGNPVLEQGKFSARRGPMALSMELYDGDKKVLEFMNQRDLQELIDFLTDLKPKTRSVKA